MINFSINDEELPYLMLQHGRIGQHVSNVSRWKEEYGKSLSEIYSTIQPYLPECGSNVVDIGSGLGGIDVLINNHYGQNSNIYLVDGMRDEPEHYKADQTFSNANVAAKFLKRNGVKNMFAIDPNWVKNGNDESHMPSFKANIVVSFASYCFHYSPMLYIDFVKAVTDEQSVIIFDVRKEDHADLPRADWIYILKQNNIRPVKVIENQKKYQRMLFRKGDY